MSFLRSLFNALVFAALTIFWSVLGAFAVIADRSGSAVGIVARWWGKTNLRVCGVRVELHGLESRTLDAPAYLVMANHTSHFDVLSLFGALPLNMRPVAKRELGYIPIFGWVLAMGAAIMIDRGDRDKAIASIERAGRAIRGGRSVLMFPEGTRTPPGELGPLKKGPFHLALSAGVPVLPVGIHGTGAVLLPGDWRIHPGRVVMSVGEPIETKGIGDSDGEREALMARVRAELEVLMKRAAGRA